LTAGLQDMVRISNTTAIAPIKIPIHFRIWASP
jgi:hypothetical protein